MESCEYVGLLGLAFQSNRSNYLGLILHRQFGNFCWLRIDIDIQLKSLPFCIHRRYPVGKLIINNRLSC